MSIRRYFSRMSLLPRLRSYKQLICLAAGSCLVTVCLMLDVTGVVWLHAPPRWPGNAKHVAYNQVLLDADDQDKLPAHTSSDGRRGGVSLRDGLPRSISGIAYMNTNSSHLQRIVVKGFWPNPENGEKSDRIVEQLGFHTDTANTKSNTTNTNITAVHLKVIQTIGFNPASHGYGQEPFISSGCNVKDCFLTTDSFHRGRPADLVAAVGEYKVTRRAPSQILMTYVLESPYHSTNYRQSANVFNWTASYRRDSTIVTPYEKFVLFKNVTSLPTAPPRDYARGKSKMVAWFVSNCRDRNGRLSYAHALSAHVQVDIYGKCGNMRCPRAQADTVCFRMLNADYRFYLAFENSNCRDYITEKLYWNALNNDIVPIVMGARPEDYRAVAPPGSYIHVDDFASPQHLAAYLQLLSTNSTMYNEYFRWKGTGEFINTKFWCRVCAMLHAQALDGYTHTYRDLSTWWDGARTCIGPRDHRRWATWRDYKAPEAGAEHGAE